jgi:hypothetical protein
MILKEETSIANQETPESTYANRNAFNYFFRGSAFITRSISCCVYSTVKGNPVITL